MQIRQIREEDIPVCAQLAKALPLGKTYRFTVEDWIRKLTKARDEQGNLLFVAEEENRLAGFAWVHTHGAFLAAPYLRFIPQRSERKGIIMMGPLPSECRESKVRYPVPWGGKGGNASWVQGLP